VSEPVVTAIETLPFPLPEAGETDSQAAVSLADHVSVPPPLLLMVMDCGAGLPLPCCAAKDRFAGENPMAGGTGAVVIANATGTVTEFVEPAALTVSKAV
jgi:hypothetical protein